MARPKINRNLFAIIFMFLLLTFSIVVLAGGFNKSLKAADYTGIGEERFSWSREIYDGVDLTHIMSYNNNKDQKTFTLSFDPKTVNLQPIIAYGGNAMYGSTMSSLIEFEESQGNHVVFGINGDAYDTSNGVANGLVISNGELITSSGASLGWGMTADGTVKYGSAALQMRAHIDGGPTLNIRHVNKERKQNTDAVFLLTDKFNDVTASIEAGVEVILEVVEAHKDKGLRIGETLTAVVKEIVHVESNPNRNKTPIGENQVVLSTHTSSPHFQTLSNLQVGTKVNVNVDDVSDDRIDWSEIVVGMGIFHLLMENGEPTNTAINNPDIHPRTSMGIKEDGSIVLMQNDGRQFGWANGLSFLEMAQYMKSIGVVTLFNFDGGGSSTIQVTMPGTEKAQILNRPSDGNERANTNALLFIAKEEPLPDKPVEKLHIYPEDSFATKALVLENSNLKFNVKATDSNYYQVPLNGNVTYSIENEEGSNIGTITSDGTFKANPGTGKGRIVASHGDLKTYFEIEVVDEITSIETDLTILSVAPGRTVPLDFRAYNNNVPVELSSESLTFELTPSTLGTVSSDGVFTASEVSETGEIKITYKEFSFTLPVEVGKQPEMILDFEDDIFSQGWTKYFIGIPNNGGSGAISINEDERFVKHGDKSLRIDYDFATNPLTGTVAIEVGKVGNYVLEGQPTAIGAWVYGDGNGGWFRIQMTGNKYVGDTRIDWVGWKYIETPIPTDAPFPYTLQKVIRLIGTGTIANNTKGTIYVDSVRAIYDFKNDDNDGPVVEAGSITPADGATVSDNQQPISLKVRDKAGEGVVYTGINTSRTKMYINNKEVTNLQQTVNPDGSVDISYVPGALDLLRPGVQNVVVRTEDNFGNKTFTEWSFTVEGYAVTINEETPLTDVIYAGEEFEYKLTTPDYRDFSAAEVKLSYDKANLTLQDVVIDSRLTATTKVIDENNGKVTLRIIGMEEVTYDPDVDFITLKFKAKDTVSGTTGIVVDEAIVFEDSLQTEIFLLGYNVPVDYKYTLSARGSTFDSRTVLSVVSEGEPVADVGFIVTKDGANFDFNLRTDANGIVTTDIFGQNSIDTEFKVRAVKDGVLSNEVTFKIVPSLGTNDPDRIVVTVGEDAATSVGISFMTNHDVDSAKVVVSSSQDLSNAVEFEATSKVVPTSVNVVEREYTSWGAFVTDLQPNTTYYYKVGSEATGWSEVKSFKTAKASGESIIAVFGDIQGGFPNFANTVTAAYNRYDDIDLSMIAGDVVDAANIFSQWNDLYTYSKNHFANNIWSSTIGNHDTNDDGEAFSGFFYGPDNGVESGNGARNYWFEINNAVVFNFDTEAGFNSYDPGYTKQIALLKEVMANTTKTFKIVNMHRSAYPLNYNEANIRALAPVFEEAGVDLVLSGHDHIYHRTTMYKSAKVEIENGVTYVVTGTSSGGKYYEGDHTRPWANVIYDDNNPVYSFIKLNEGKLTFEAYAIESSGTKKIDEFSIEKFELDLEVSSGGKLVGPRYAREGDTLNYTVELEENHILVSVKVNGKTIPFTDNKFVVENVKPTDKIEVEIAELTVPYATDVKIKGKFLTGSTLEVEYTFNSPNGGAEAGTIVRWYVDGTKVGDGKTLVLKEAWLDKTIEVRVTAKTATETGIEVVHLSTETVELFGDLNKDGVVTKEDAMLLLQTITGKVELTEDYKYYANINGDDATLQDVRNILAAMGGN